jgi:segregation and condensation protein A
LTGAMSVNVRLEIYEGPLDLLLHLIKKNELSVIDIPIATITEQYLATLELMQSLNLDVSGEYLVMAATLLHIKSKMLLPPDEVDSQDEDDDELDSRDELIRRLLEYERFKEAAKELEGRERLNRDVFTRSGQASQVAQEISFDRISIFDLISAFQHVLDRFPSESVHTVVLEPVSLRERMTLILDELHRRSPVVFQSLFEKARSRIEAITTFLAMLELIKMRAIRVSQSAGLGPIHMEPAISQSEMSDRMEEMASEDEYGD